MTPVEQILAKIEAGRLTVAVIGLGYVGLPLALAFAEAGVDVIGVDIDPAKPRALLAAKAI